MHLTDTPARRHTTQSLHNHVSPNTKLKQAEDDIDFRDPFMAGPIDFNSEFGFKEAKGKKKGGAKAKSNTWADDAEEKKDGEDGGDEGNKDSAGGDTGSGAGAGDGSGDKKDDENGGDAAADDDWGFATTTKKKKGKKGKVDDVTSAAEPAVSKFDAFTEIKLDDTGPMLDLSFDTGPSETKSPSSFGAWGSSWNTGATTTQRLVDLIARF